MAWMLLHSLSCRIWSRSALCSALAPLLYVPQTLLLCPDSLSDLSQCRTLKTLFNSKTLSSGTSSYEAFTSSYWSNQAAAVDPTCVFKPSHALEVSTAVLLSRLTSCPFAVKGGGHTAFSGASSIEGGITIALENLNEVTLSSDKKTVAVGPGNRWGAVYGALEQHGLAVVGGRVSTFVFVFPSLV